MVEICGSHGQSTRRLRVPLTKRLVPVPPCDAVVCGRLDFRDFLIHLTRQAFADIVRHVTYRFCRARGGERNGHSQPDVTRLPVM